ncbi:MAG: ribosome hibernation-promoting factor, HPF/YfiA family [Vicinamibacterales bacterium]
MRLELTGRHVNISPGLRSLVNQKLARVLRQVNDSGISAAVIVTKEKFNRVVEASLHARGERFLHAIARAETWELAVNQAVEKLEQQARKMKGKWHERKRRAPGPKAAPAPPVEEPPAARTARKRRVLRATRYSVKPMTVEEASMELEEMDAPFLVFRDALTETVNVIYRRKDGQLGLIEPEV